MNDYCTEANEGQDSSKRGRERKGRKAIGIAEGRERKNRNGGGEFLPLPGKTKKEVERAGSATFRQ